MEDDKLNLTQSYLEFGPTQIAIFEPVTSAIEEFAHQHGLTLSRNFDRDPLRPFACYFLKTGGRSFIRICAADPFVDQSQFRSQFVIAGIPARGKGENWDYCSDDGLDRLRMILEEAKVISEQV